MFNKLHIFIRIPCQQSSIIYLWNISAGSVCRSLIVEAGTERKTRLWQQQPPHNTTSNVASRLVGWRCSGLPPCLLACLLTNQPNNHPRHIVLLCTSSPRTSRGRIRRVPTRRRWSGMQRDAKESCWISRRKLFNVFFLLLFCRRFFSVWINNFQLAFIRSPRRPTNRRRFRLLLPSTGKLK